MNVWLSSTCQLQTDLILKEDASAVKPRAQTSSQTPQAS